MYEAENAFIDSLIADINHLKAENESLKNSKRTFKAKNKKLKAKIERMEKENAELKARLEKAVELPVKSGDKVWAILWSCRASECYGGYIPVKKPPQNFVYCEVAE